MTNFYENNRSPFDPEWYKQAFDSFISTADELYRHDQVVKEGYEFKDKDGSRSSVFRRDAILNNSFNEKILRDTLRDIYSNSSHKLIASSHDNTHFFQYHTCMNEVKYDTAGLWCEFSIPTETFLSPMERDMYKLSQYFRKWITVDDILSHWDIFKWHCMIFVNQRVSSEYMFHIDDRETRIRFPYYEIWRNNNYPISIYKFDTYTQNRCLISMHLCENEWNWKLPISYLKDQRIGIATKAIVCFNKILDKDIREDSLERVEYLGENIEFMSINDGYIDLKKISQLNNIYIHSELKEYIWMSIIVPKFFHEYPVLLPTDQVYQPYIPNWKPVVTLEQDIVKHANAENNANLTKQLYVDMNGELKEAHNSWSQMIRPIVLSDAFDHPNEEDYTEMIEDLNLIRDATVEASDELEKFRNFLKAYTTDTKFYELVESVYNNISDVREKLHQFMSKRAMEYDYDYETKYNIFVAMIESVRKEGINSKYFYTHNNEDDFFAVTSPCIYMPREFMDKYNVVRIIHSMHDYEKVVWEDVDKFMDRIRFQRPIEVSDFWTFEYDVTNRVWRPYPLAIENHFPDVYLSTDPKNEDTRDRIFKAFFFYSDTINVTNTDREIDHSTPDWDNDSTNYYFNQGGTYRDIFMEKFYWLGIRSIYRGLLMTNARWEIIENVINNPSYERFNDLFINTMDPYFKLGLATYLKSDNYNFPFDDAVDKLNESINQEFLKYKRVTNFEAYLDRSWIPSYFDFIEKIMDNYDYTNRLLRRPRNTFDITRLMDTLITTQRQVYEVVVELNNDINSILDKLQDESYNLDIEAIQALEDLANIIRDNITHVLDFTESLDMELYSIDDINHIIECLRKHFELTAQLDTAINTVSEDIRNKLVYDKKQIAQARITEILNSIPAQIDIIVNIIQEFDMDHFMLATNDLRSYLYHDKYNPDDYSLLGEVNKFETPWPEKVKESRDKLFVDTTILFGLYDPEKAYGKVEVEEFVLQVSTVKDDITDLSYVIREFWVGHGYQENQTILDRLDFAYTFLDKLVTTLNLYLAERAKLVSLIEAVYEQLDIIMSVTNISKEPDMNTRMHAELEAMLMSLSYIVGTNKKLEALEHLENAKNIHLNWIYLVSIEQEVFDTILDMLKIPGGYIYRMLINQVTLETAIEYMDTVNNPYTPESTWPTYSEVFEVESAEMTSGGLLHYPSDTVFVPDLGVFEVIGTENEARVAVGIKQLPFRTTSFKNPEWHSGDFDSITSGIGMGIRVKPTKIKRIPVINDEVVNSILTRIENLIKQINKCISTPNPYNNSEFIMVIGVIDKLQDQWKNILSVYREYMSDHMRVYMEELVGGILVKLTDPCKTFIDTRGEIEVKVFLNTFQEYIFDTYAYIEKLDISIPDFYYYDNEIRLAYNKLNSFYGNGVKWNDDDTLVSIMNEVMLPIRYYKRNIIDPLENSDTKESILYTYKTLEEFYDVIIKSISQLPYDRIAIDPILTILEKKLDATPTFKKDVWYKMKFFAIAEEGMDYRIGDIVKVVHEDHTDDPLFFQVIRSEFGSVLAVYPLIQYALPYEITGVFDTTTMVGKGSGLKLSLTSYQLELQDSTLFDEDNTDSNLPPFDENDLFMFRFDNIHDLDIGYEVFLAGKQITDFIQRHETSNNPLHPQSVDVLYLNANDVMGLQNASIYIPGENYFIYKIDEVQVLDPGAGYCVGQDIFIDADQMLLRLQVASLVYGPTKGIEEIGYGRFKLLYDGGDISVENGEVITDSLNNIDDEFNVGYYDKLTENDRNSKFMYPDIDTVPSVIGDPEYRYLPGKMYDKEWKRYLPLVCETDPVMPGGLEIPGDPRWEYQLFKRVRIHNSIGETNTDIHKKFDNSIINQAMVKGDLIASSIEAVPRWLKDWPEAELGMTVIVEHDSTHEDHRMLYKIRTFTTTGMIVYELPEYADYKWTSITVDWMNIDSYPDMPTDKVIYSDEDWDTLSRSEIGHRINLEFATNNLPTLRKNNTSFIKDLNITDISVFNWTLKKWEDLSDTSRWRLVVVDNDDTKEYYFTLSFLQEGIYSYDMSFYWNKKPNNQMRNAELKRNARLSVKASISDEVNTPGRKLSIYTGRHVRIRKLFPYEQKESYRIGRELDGTLIGYEMDFKLAPYIHFKNEIHLEDIKIYNKSAGRFENVLDRTKFEVRFKDDKAVERGYETQTDIKQMIISNEGESFVDGEVWGYNEDYDVHVFGYVTTENGCVKSFIVDHFTNAPTENIVLEFRVYQRLTQTRIQEALILLDFQTTKLQVHGDGYIHSVLHRMAPVTDEFKVIVQYNLDEPTEYDIIISKRYRTWKFMNPLWTQNPVYTLPNVNIPKDHLYIWTNSGRIPLVNPSTGISSLSVVESANSTEVTFNNLTKRYEQIEIHSTPYPMRSVYVQRNIPQNGFIDLEGKLNKPLSKKYFEFWVNGKLLFDEVTIVSPTKLFLHGLTSLKNFEIIEINRDPNEYFSDAFLSTDTSKSRPIQVWNYRTYLDDALEGKLEKDNYTEEEQNYLLTPVWKQVPENHPEYKNYPPNVDIDDDILIRTIKGDNPLEDIGDPSFQFMILDYPTIEGFQIISKGITFEHLGFIPISDTELIDMMNEEWKDEIADNPYFPPHSVMSDEEWYGMAARLYDEYGILVHTLDDAAYKIVDSSILKITSSSKSAKIIKSSIVYDLR